LINLGEFFFKRPESELSNSVDFLFTHDLDLKTCDFLQLVFLIECKYRTRGTIWFFTQHPQNDAGEELFIENFLTKGKCNRKSFPSLTPPLGEKLPITGKGIEIYSTGQRNEKSIREGIHQLMFAAGSTFIRAFFSEDSMIQLMANRGIDIKGRSYHSLVCPILVTSAELRFLKEMTIEEIEKSENLPDISKSEKVITLSTPVPPPYIRRFITENVAEDAISLLDLSRAIDRDRARALRVKTFLTKYSMLLPSRYYIVKYQSIREFVQKYISFASALLTFAHKTKEVK